MLIAVVLAALLMFAAGGVDWAWIKGTQAYTQAAADAAALAGAMHTVTAQQVDARGSIYASTTIVDPAAGPQAAAVSWNDALAGWPAVQTLSFTTVPTGATLQVTARVQVKTLGLSLVSAALGIQQWTVVAEARCNCP